MSYEFDRSLRIVKATPIALMILSDAAVTGTSSAKNATNMPLVQLGLQVVRVLCPKHRMAGRAVVDSGPMVGVLLGTSSISFEFTGPVVARVRGLVQAAPWGGCFVTKRVIRYCGLVPEATVTVKGPSVDGEISGRWEQWRVRGFPTVSVAIVQ
ncbi:Hypothetical protein, putative [Bodo saltans]|uniref:Uncharacterized protein n=1 Tax=Bodo saltans TaxID=75058 RepID=A0A0S4JJZ8_BODSA|nr:Hypothetical protein, putative [Bodo saltans]|eukprot:CUG90497.1 Hypothetical protein, putative [Bodo saltans]